MLRLWFQSLIEKNLNRANAICSNIVSFASSQGNPRTLAKHYQVSSTASIETLWQTINDLAGLASWHPLITSTNAPNGQQAKPGLIYRVFARWVPVPIKIFVENVLPGEYISLRIFPLPGVEERAIYRLESGLYGTLVSYSVELKGWLSPVAWSFLQPYAARVADALAQAAEQATTSGIVPKHYRDIFS
ncbi:SRPBCC family protein [Leptothoe kymatousa]|uniref:SRPBCC family protein n=1 Tax=Leptothoe kymatousa TAU-MAC 1615 TaxID=2364775 RepID=A0ABS5Y0R9_9CYAN|nr:SRPBCC family protein [Leptothoe kymatousa]MBT9311400.1 SRPBCC family protein [Leptothoe kymatousa TAU-MAC 1615]